MKCGLVDPALSPLQFSKWRQNRGMGCFTKIFFAYLMCAMIVAFVETCFPSRAMLYANMNAVEERGRSIYRAITSRECLGDITWPKSFLSDTTYAIDIPGTSVKTSTEYFEALFRIENDVSTNRLRLVNNFDYTKLAGVGVPLCPPERPLTAANNMWIIAANITEQDDERTPFLITRNVDVKEIESVVNQGLTKEQFKKRILFSKVYREPFCDKGFVTVRKDGRMVCIKSSRNATLGELFDNKELPPRDPSKPPIVYLMP
jgi:hypothetical protein